VSVDYSELGLALASGYDWETWQRMGQTAPVSPPPGQTTTQGSSGSNGYAEALQRSRNSAFDEMTSALRGYGIDVDGTGLSAQIRGWAQEDKSPAWIQIELRNTQAYKTRFPGMTALIARGQAISEAEYISQERAYRGVLQSYGVPTEFFDGPEDFGKLISGGVSVKELDDRVQTAETFVNGRPEISKAMQDFYGVDKGNLIAYVLDADRGQALLEKQSKAALAAGSAAQYGFTVDRSLAEQLGGTLGDQYNRIGADQVQAQQEQFQKLGQLADEQTRLASIDQTEFVRESTLSSELLGDTAGQLASQARRQREQARFTGSGAARTGTLSRIRT